MTEDVGSAVPVVEMADVTNLQGFRGGFDTAAHCGEIGCRLSKIMPS